MKQAKKPLCHIKAPEQNNWHVWNVETFNDTSIQCNTFCNSSKRLLREGFRYLHVLERERETTALHFKNMQSTSVNLELKWESNSIGCFSHALASTVYCMMFSGNTVLCLLQTVSGVYENIWGYEVPWKPALLKAMTSISSMYTSVKRTLYPPLLTVFS